MASRSIWVLSLAVLVMVAFLASCGGDATEAPERIVEVPVDRVVERTVEVPVDRVVERTVKFPFRFP